MNNIDFIIPNKNEKLLITKSEQLGIKRLCLVYEFKDFEKRKKMISGGIKIFYGVLCNLNELGKARRMADFTLVKNPERKIIENKKPSIVFDLELGSRKDFMFQRNSGLNHILCRLLVKNKITYYINFSQILESKNKQVLLGRIIQNLRLCNKYKVKVGVGSFARKPAQMRNPQDMKSFLKLEKKKFIYPYKN